jgi:hypothetical protein
VYLPELYEPFPLRVEYQTRILLGRIMPWSIPRDSVIPTRFTVYIDDVFRGHVTFRNNEWREFQGNMGDQGLVNAIGEYIAIWFE